MLRGVKVRETTIDRNTYCTIDSSFQIAQYVQTFNNAKRNSFSERGRVIFLFFTCFGKNKNRCSRYGALDTEQHEQPKIPFFELTSKSQKDTVYHWIEVFVVR